MKKIIYILLLFVTAKYLGQTITPTVINSAGGNFTLTGGITLSDNVGEPFTSTIGNANNKITQGFLQNFVISPFFTATETHNNVSCKDKKDGKISLALTTNVPTYTAQYFWTPLQVCPTNNCSGIDSLKPGTYTVRVKINYFINGQPKTDTSNVFVINISDNNGPCKIKIFTGITANGDGVNDGFFIENINEYPNNRLLIYNRWGHLLYDEKGYDNITKVWPSKEEIGILSTTTYFYVLYLDEGSNPIKGWVELMKN